VILTIDGLNQGGNRVIVDTLFTVYDRLHIIVEEEIADNREQCHLNWNQKIRDSWEVYTTQLFVPEEYGWLQYKNSSRVQVLADQFREESWEILESSDVLWEEKEMLWISSLGERQRLKMEFPATTMTYKRW
jgi:hypothetical protein